MKGVRQLTAILVLSLLGSSVTQAQNHARNWYFGQGAGLSFHGDYPMPLTDGQMHTPEGAATYSDEDGKLLCYSDGDTLWGPNHNVIIADLAGSDQSTMGAYFVPDPINSDRVYLFATKAYDNTPGADNSGGHYYLIDFSDQNPLGKVVQDHSDNPFVGRSTEKILAIPFGEGKAAETGIEGYWIIGHEFGSKLFFVYELTDGLSDTSLSFSVGTEHSHVPPSNRGASGYMKASLQGDKIAVAIEGQKTIDLFRFNNDNAELRHLMSLPLGSSGNLKEKVNAAYGVEFSPLGRFLYATSRTAGVVYQYDLTSQGIFQGEGIRIIRNRSEDPCGAMQLAPNGKIYVAIDGKDYLGVINRPDRSIPFGSGAEYEEYGVRLINTEDGIGGTSELGLPQFDMSDFELIHYGISNNCAGDTVNFYLTGEIGGGYSGSQTSWELWNYENTGKYFLHIDNELLTARWDDPIPGNFILKVNTRFRGDYYYYQDTIIIYKPIDVVLQEKDTTLFCRGDSILLDAGVGAFYAWDDRDLRERYNWVSDPDMLGDLLKEFRVEVTGYNGCLSEDIIFLWIKNPPTIDTVYTKRAVCGDPTGRAEIIPDGRLEDFDFWWEDFPDNTTNIIDGVYSGDYVVYYQRNKGASCKASKIITVPELGVSNVSLEASDTSMICPGETITLTVSGEGATDYEWIYPAGLTSQVIQVSPQENTTYSVRVIAREAQDSCDVIVSYTARVQEVTPPDMEAEYHSCEGDTLLLTAPDGYSAYHWSTGQEGRFLALTANPGVLVLTVTDQYDCQSSLELSATFHEAPEVDLGPDRTECTRDPIVLSGGVGQTYHWNTGEDTPELAVTQSGLYALSIGDYGCFNTDSILVTILHPDSLIIDSVNYTDISCYGAHDGRIEIFARGTGSEFLYSLDGGSTFPSESGIFEDLRPGYFYELAVMEDGKCITVYPTPVQIHEPDDMSFDVKTRLPNCLECTNGSIRIIDLKGGTEPYTIQWNTMDFGAELSGIPAGSYRVTITDAHQCTITRDIELEVGLRIADAFTPNGDGLNDTWSIRVLQMYPRCQVQVFDRSGRLVFESLEGYADSQAWNGTLLNSGETLPMGTYYYLIRLDTNDDKDPVSGSVTLIR